MGFKATRSNIRLVFDDPTLEGLDVLTRSVPLGTFMQMIDIAQLGGKDLSVSDIQSVGRLFEDFAEHALLEWNIEDADGQPVPATLEGMQTQDTGLMLQIVLTWMSAIGGVTGPLVSSSPNGSTPDSLS